MLAPFCLATLNGEPIGNDGILGCDLERRSAHVLEHYLWPNHIFFSVGHLHRPLRR